MSPVRERTARRTASGVRRCPPVRRARHRRSGRLSEGRCPRAGVTFRVRGRTARTALWVVRCVCSCGVWCVVLCAGTGRGLDIVVFTFRWLEQALSTHETSAGVKIGTSSRDAGSPRRGDEPGPGAYGTADGIGRQALSTRPSAPGISFTRSPRDQTRADTTPGPAHYAATLPVQSP